MILTVTQRRVLRAFARTGTADRVALRRATHRYHPTLLALVRRGLVEKDPRRGWVLTQLGSSHMTEVCEEVLL